MDAESSIIKRAKLTRRWARIILALLIILICVRIVTPLFHSKSSKLTTNSNTITGSSGSNSNTAQASGHAIVAQATGNAMVQIGGNTTIVNQGIPPEKVQEELENLWAIIKQQLIDKYPAGYALFGAANGRIVAYVPPHKESAEWQIDV